MIENIVTVKNQLYLGHLVLKFLRGSELVRAQPDNPYGENTRCQPDEYYDGLSSTSEEPEENIDWSKFDEEESSVANQERSYSEEFQATLKQSLAQWVVECNIPRIHVTNLLKRLI